MELQNIIGANLHAFRTKLGLKQEQVAEFLAVDTSLISKYENGTNEVTYVHLKKLSHLFNVEVEDLLEEDSARRDTNFAFAFRSEGLESADLKSIAEFQRVVKNYLKMDALINEKS
ncbi:helix-turn-helix domain-containing protein [Algoriphagus sp.]|uniref:helix-turn-helix domain-containing protein n=1 Tax=Algoriphagus sp. TaxID=1872435 RepID=UPI003F71DAF3